jgi:succinylglutamic semialdehyde dehydrogenase
MKSLYINGQWQKGGGAQFSSLNPATREVVWSGCSASEADVNLSLEKAKDAFLLWSQLGLEKRLAYLEKYRGLLERDKQEFAELISDETGKPLWESLTEVGAMIGKLNHCVNAYHERCSEKVSDVADAQSILRFRAIGVMAVFGPFNLPGHLPNGHILPALLAGNTVVFKPSEQTPASSAKMIELFAEIGLPAGVVNLVQGAADVGRALLKNSHISGVLFTGSYRVGRLIHQSLAGRPEVILALEMGGNNPLLVWDVNDLKAAAYIVIQSAFITSGQRCVCARRLIIPNNQQGDEFLSELLRLTRNITVGLPRDEREPFLGPLISDKSGDLVMKEQELLLKKGANALIECRQEDDLHSLVSPGILDVTGLTLDDGEIFGPLLQLIRVDTFGEAIIESNKTKFGLSAGLVSDNRELYRSFLEQSTAGIINWNRQITGAVSSNPFGGSGASGNFRPSAYFAADYCAYPVASIEKAKLELPAAISPGIQL